MKTKQIIQLFVAIAILFVAGLLIFTQLTPKKGAAANKGMTYEVITMIESDYSSSAMSKLKDANEAKNFYAKPDLKNGVGNRSPFGGL
ncbi:hypothetical protein EPO04_02895 [Patescibacteria group bacterium]|nr:MAG: hypothetical protein EPO04_02895 [Patescibacteria group bacterium]